MGTKKFKWKRKRESTTKTSFNCSEQVKIQIKKAKTLGPLDEIDEIEILLHITDARVQQRFEQSIF